MAPTEASGPFDGVDSAARYRVSALAATAHATDIRNAEARTTGSGVGVGARNVRAGAAGSGGRACAGDGGSRAVRTGYRTSAGDGGFSTLGAGHGTGAGDVRLSAVGASRGAARDIHTRRRRRGLSQRARNAERGEGQGGRGHTGQEDSLGNVLVDSHVVRIPRRFRRETFNINSLRTPLALRRCVVSWVRCITQRRASC